MIIIYCSSSCYCYDMSSKAEVQPEAAALHAFLRRGRQAGEGPGPARHRLSVRGFGTPKPLSP